MGQRNWDLGTGIEETRQRHITSYTTIADYNAGRSQSGLPGSSHLRLDLRPSTKWEIGRTGQVQSLCGNEGSTRPKDKLLFRTLPVHTELEVHGRVGPRSYGHSERVLRWRSRSIEIVWTAGDQGSRKELRRTETMPSTESKTRKREGTGYEIETSPQWRGHLVETSGWTSQKSVDNLEKSRVFGAS